MMQEEREDDGQKDGGEKEQWIREKKIEDGKQEINIDGRGPKGKKEKRNGRNRLKKDRRKDMMGQPQKKREVGERKEPSEKPDQSSVRKTQRRGESSQDRANGSLKRVVFSQSLAEMFRTQ